MCVKSVYHDSNIYYEPKTLQLLELNKYSINLFHIVNKRNYLGIVNMTK